MLVHSMRKAVKDAYLDVRKCVLNLLPQRPFDGSLPKSCQSILVISQRRLGDIALEIPALSLLREAFKTATLGIVAPGPYHVLLDWAVKPDALFNYPTNLFGARTLGAELHRWNWQVAIDFTTDFHLAPARLLKNSKAPIRIGFANSGREHYFNFVIPDAAAEHMADRFLRPIRLLGVDYQNPPSLPDLPDPAVELPIKSRGGRLVGIHPGATHWTQRWPAEYFAELAIRIREDGNCCVIMGGENDLPQVNEIGRVSNCAILPMSTGVDALKLAAILRQLDLLICNNSGPLHLANLLGVPTLSFMGPTVKERWWPQNPRARVLRCDNLPCIGCNQGYCWIGTHACMRSIMPDSAFEVFKSVKER